MNKKSVREKVTEGIMGSLLYIKEKIEDIEDVYNNGGDTVSEAYNKLEYIKNEADEALKKISGNMLAILEEDTEDMEELQDDEDYSV